MPWRGPSVEGEVPTLGNLVIDWIEDTLVMTDGPLMGEPVKLYEEQAQHILNRYQLDPDADGDAGNDAFQYGGSMIVRGQKWGKDPLGAMIDLFHAFGPCQFAGWDADGNPVGAPHPSPWVFIAALNDQQTDNTWLPLREMVLQSQLVDLAGVEVNLDMIRLPCGNPIEPLTTTAYGRLGGRFTAGSLTENGVMTSTGVGEAGRRSPKAFANTLIRSIGGMGGMWLAMTNTWDPTELSHAQNVFEANDKHIFVDARISRRHIDLADEESLADEIRYLYGDSLTERGGHVSLQRIIREVQGDTDSEATRRRFFLSEILAGETPLVTPERWAALERGPLHTDAAPLMAGQKVTLGFDGSRSRDATALTAVRVSDNRIFHLGTWLPVCMCEDARHESAATCPDPRVDRALVDLAVHDAFEAYNVAFLYGDPFKWQEYLALWAAAWPKRVVEFATNWPERMDRMIELFTTAVTNNELTHDGEPTLTEHVRGAVIAKGGLKQRKRIDDEGRTIEHHLKIVKRTENSRIDAVISMLLALVARDQAIKDGALDPDAPPAAPSKPARGGSARVLRAGFDPRNSSF